MIQCFASRRGVPPGGDEVARRTVSMVPAADAGAHAHPQSRAACARTVLGAAQADTTAGSAIDVYKVTRAADGSCTWPKPFRIFARNRDHGLTDSPGRFIEDPVDHAVSMLSAAVVLHWPAILLCSRQA